MNSDTGSVLGIISIIISVGGTIYAAINHKRFRCKCCGRDIDVQVDVDSTEARKSVPSEKVDVHVPNQETNEVVPVRPPRRAPRVAPEDF